MQENELKINQYSVGEQVCVLVGYNLIRATIIKINKKKIKVDVQDNAIFGHIRHTRNVEPEKMTKYHEDIAVIWEQWKGVNGRGGYRIERVLYPQSRKPANLWCRSFGYLWEPTYGSLDPHHSQLKV